MNDICINKQVIATILLLSVLLLSLTYLFSNKDKLHVARFQYEQFISAPSIPYKISIYDDSDELIYKGRVKNYCIHDFVQHKCILFLDSFLDSLPTDYKLISDSNYYDSFSATHPNSLVLSFDRYHLIIPKSDIEKSIIEVAGLLKSGQELNPELSEIITNSETSLVIPEAGELPYREVLFSFPERTTALNEVFEVSLDYECNSRNNGEIILSDNLISVDSIVINESLPCEGRRTHAFHIFATEDKLVNSLVIRNYLSNSEILINKVQLVSLKAGY